MLNLLIFLKNIIDMCKTQEITLRQDSNFGEIYIERVNV